MTRHAIPLLLVLSLCVASGPGFGQALESTIRPSAGEPETEVFGQAIVYVPEPGMLPLLATGSALLGLLARRRRAAEITD